MRSADDTLIGDRKGVVEYRCRKSLAPDLAAQRGGELERQLARRKNPVRFEDPGKLRRRELFAGNLQTHTLPLRPQELDCRDSHWKAFVPDTNS